MALDFTLVLRADTAAAKAELEATARGIKGVTTATEQSAAKSRVAATASDAEAAAKRRSAQASREVASANQMAAGATGNLVSQFNDIGMMLMAGQNPLQLAIQQGSQITQVIGPMGAAGAAKALGSAVLSLLSPFNLLTLGVIYFGAQAVQAFSGASEEASKVADALEQARTAAAETQAEIDKLRFGVDEGYQVDLLQEQIRLRDEYNLKVAELQGYLGSTTDSIDRQRIKTADLRGEIEGIVARYDEISKSLADQQNRSAQLAVLKGIEAQRAGELAAKEKEAEQAAAALQAKVVSLIGSLRSVDGSRLVAAFQSAFPVASQLLGLAQSIVGTLGTASAQAAAYDSAKTAGLAAQYSQYGAGRTIGERLARESGSLYGGRRVIPAPVVSGGGGGGGGAAARDEADALQELIDSLEAEIEALHTQDPIQQEMLKHREALAGATEAERKKVEDLIATREREQLLMEGAKARAQFFEDIGTSALESLIVKGESFNDVLKNIAKSLIDAALQAAIFGKGPFGSLFGGKSILSGLFGGGGGGGGGLGSLLGGGDLFGGLAGGGKVFGPGTGTSDSIPKYLSNGEYVVNARATARHQPLLEAINSGGRITGYAEGGYVGSDNRRLSTRGAGRDLPASIYMDFRGVKGDREIEAVARQSAAQVVAMYDREGLPVSIQRVSSDAKRRG